MEDDMTTSQQAEQSEPTIKLRLSNESVAIKLSATQGEVQGYGLGMPSPEVVAKVSAKLQSLYDALSYSEKNVMDALIYQAAAHYVPPFEVQ
jgi:hypothetical protein